MHLNISADEKNSWRREPLDNLEGTQPVRIYVGRSFRVNMLKWGFSNDPETCDRGIMQADHATSTGLPYDGHCLLSPRPDNR